MRKLAILFLGHKQWFWLAAMVAIIAVLVPMPAHAVSLTNGAFTILSDSFENNVTSASDFDPDPALWAVTEADPTRSQVLSLGDGVTTPVLANHGSNFLKMFRLANDNSASDPTGDAENTVIHNFATQTSGQLSLKLAVWQSQFVNQPNPNVSMAASIALAAGPSGVAGTNPSVIVGAWRQGGSVANTMRAIFDAGSGDAWNDITIDGTSTPLTWTPESWMEWQIDLDMDVAAASRTYTLTVDGILSNPIPVWNPGDLTTLNVASLIFRNGSRGTVFAIDAVPEPTSHVLLGLGGLLMMAVRRRSRRRRSS